MTRSAPVLWVGIVVALCTASCTSTPPASALAPAPPVAPLSCGFGDNVPMLPTNFDPSAINTDPPTNGPQAPNEIKDSLRKAYAAAPPFFRARLCGLAGIFVTEAPDSFGYRNYINGKRYIGLAKNMLWAGNPSQAIPLNEYENKILMALLLWPPPAGTQNPTPTYLPASYSSSLADDGHMAVLAALAHELGHVQWAEILVNPRHTPPKFGLFCLGIFPDHAWQTEPPFRTWQRFALDRDDNNIDVQDDPGGEPDDPIQPGDPSYQDVKIVKLQQALAVGDVVRSKKIMKRLLARKRPWPSVFGAFSVNEQFVESFVLYTMTHATPQLTRLPLQVTINGVTREKDVPRSLQNRPLLLEILNCFDTWYRNHPTP